MSARVLIVTSRYYADIAKELEAGAHAELKAQGVDASLIEVPGAFEIPGAIAMAADSGRFDAYIGLGCVIRGETTHYDYVCGETARGLMSLSFERRLAVGFGVLTVETMEQAMKRADRTQGNKGRDAAIAALRMCTLRKELLLG